MITFTFKTNGGPQVVDINDDKLEKFINAAKTCTDNWGNHPEHPIDFCQIAYQAYLEDMISEEDCDYYRDKFTEIMKNFHYENE